MPKVPCQWSQEKRWGPKSCKKPLLFWWVAANMIFYSVSFVLFFHSIVCEYFEVLPCLSTLVAPRIQIDLPVRDKQFDTFPKKMHWRSFCMSFSSKEYIFRRKRSRHIKCIPQKFAFYEYWNDGKFTRPKSWYSNSRGNKVDKHGNARSKQTNKVYRSRYFIAPPLVCGIKQSTIYDEKICLPISQCENSKFYKSVCFLLSGNFFF